MGVKGHVKYMKLDSLVVFPARAFSESVPPVFVCLSMCLHSRACELTLLRPLWQLFMSMENSLSLDPTSITVLLPLHRALTELFFIAEARAIVSDTHTFTGHI